MKQLKFNLFFIFYFLFYELSFLILLVLSFFSKTIKTQIKDRKISTPLLSTIKEHKGSKQSILFYCSSAGEFEQACPIIDHYKKLNYHIFIVFFSPSGILFAKKRNETNDFILAPFDQYFSWKKLLDVLDPKFCFILRHELWPAFIKLASQKSKLILLNASMNRKYNPGSLFLKKLLLSMMDMIFVVDRSDLSFYEGIVKDSFLAGDTKYDRVRLQSISKQQDIMTLRKRLHALDIWTSVETSSDSFNLEDRFKYFIIGSGWHKDISYCFDSFLDIKKLDPSWKIICASHDVSSKMIDFIKDECKIRDFTFIQFSKLDSEAKIPSDFDVLIVDVIGRLSELYGSSHLCWIGGALHYKIHNVLEAAIFGLNIAHGPLYTDQKEAVLLVKEGLSEVFDTSSKITQWWKNHINPSINQKTRDFILSLSFTSKTILDRVEQKTTK